MEADGGGFLVSMELPPSASSAGCLRSIRGALSAASHGAYAGATSLREQVSAGGDAVRHQLQRWTSGEGTLRVTLTQWRDPGRGCSLEVQGPLSQADLSLFSAATRGAFAAGSPVSGVERHEDWDDDLQTLGALGHGLTPFVAHMREMMRALQMLDRDDADEGFFGVGLDEERDGPPFQGKRMDDWRHGAASGGDGSGVGPAGGPVPPGRSAAAAAAAAAEKVLTEHGATVIHPGPPGSLDWGVLAGYTAQKRQIEDTILLALLHPEVYSQIVSGTRTSPGAPRPRAVLFEGPPGTGKTTSARLLATQAGVPLVYIPLESIASKWYGEAESRLAKLLAACEALPDGCIVFLDEVDSLATARGEGMHEATRRTLGVLLRHLDGFDPRRRTVVIAATNRKRDLDPALLSRFTASVHFGLPSDADRASILARYAKHLAPAALQQLADATPGLAGRDLRDICEQAERRWASKVIRGEADTGTLPSLETYMEAAQQRLQEKVAAVPPYWRT